MVRCVRQLRLESRFSRWMLQYTFAATNTNHEYGGYGDEPRRKREDNNKPNHVLLFTIINPVYPITVEVLHTISAPSGQVQRIVIFKKNGVQAMVEFDSVESATRAKETLHGADIYSGCCTLKIDFAKPTKLNVYKNDAESWDYTTPALDQLVNNSAAAHHGSSTHKNDATGNGRPAPLLAEPRYGAAPQPYGSTPQVTFPPSAGHDRYEENFNGPATYAEPYVERYGIKSDFSGREPLHPTPPRPGYVPTLGQTPPSSTQGSVMMVYGLQPDKVNTDKLFNLFCLYGNVTKVKFLKTKEGCAMIQMGDSIAVERCLQNLNNVTIGTDGRLQLGFSKQAFLSDVTNPYILPDKTASFKDFTGSKNNRFLNPAMANKNRIQPPSKIVHFFNTPPDLTEDTVNRVFVERGIEAPTTVKLFPLKSERSSSGLIEFSSVGIAVAAIMECNHTALENSSGVSTPGFLSTKSRRTSRVTIFTRRRMTKEVCHPTCLTGFTAAVALSSYLSRRWTETWCRGAALGTIYVDHPERVARTRVDGARGKRARAEIASFLFLSLSLSFSLSLSLSLSCSRPRPPPRSRHRASSREHERVLTDARSPDATYSACRPRDTRRRWSLAGGAGALTNTRSLHRKHGKFTSADSSRPLRRESRNEQKVSMRFYFPCEN
ncbi:heterogeneous nuclear ribonucleoprotein L isoform X1 [Linepithema humile]|uniref:heterogeneous nuclear ribonucleoprotein L isoform X1 n=1 Tax=Linepithema humile TaxID=83485 RepID=UPI00351EC83F